MRLGYHAGVLVDHDPVDAVAELRAIGFASVAVRLHPAWLHPLRPDHLLLRRLRAAAEGTELILDGDAPFLLAPRSRDEPPLLDAAGGPQPQRLELAAATLRLAGAVGARLTTLASGPKPAAQADEAALNQFAAACRTLCRQAESVGTALAIRPSLGGFVESIAHFERIGQWLSDATVHPRLAADLGVMATRGELPVVPLLARNPSTLACVYVPLGSTADGHRVDAAVVAAGLREIGFQGDLILVDNAPQHATLEAAEAVYARYASG